MATKWQGEPKRWRVRGRSTDGLIVTLGRHDTEKAAQADAEKFVKEGFYRDVTVERIKPAGDSSHQDA
ncbi:MAG: hypothetical protein KAY37_16505 [Phycisphaerae bacterium]|nr:hypothetical protein [Phycisphaerae bacterium]